MLPLSPIQDSLYPSEGISIVSVGEGTPAESAGVEVGAVYDRLNNESVLAVRDFMDGLEGLKPGDAISLGNGTASIPLTLGRASF